MREFFETYKFYVIFSLSIVGISLGLVHFFPIWQTLPILLGIWGVTSLLIDHFRDDAPEKQLLEIISTLEEEIAVQNSVIDDYNTTFDALSIQLPCICGGTTFEGLFSPNTQTEVECEKCHNKYRVEITYNTVLISESMDMTKPIIV